MEKPNSGTANELNQTNRAIEHSKDLFNNHGLTKSQADHVASAIVYPNTRNSIESAEMARTGARHNEFLTDNLVDAKISTDGNYCSVHAQNDSFGISITAVDSPKITSSIGYEVAVLRLP